MPEGRKDIIVGVDLSESSRRAVRWAAREAAARRLPLRLVHVLTWPSGEDVQRWLPEHSAVFRPLQEELRSEIDAAADIARGIDPQIEVHGDVQLGDPAEVLGTFAREAGLLVLGGPGDDGSNVVGPTPAELLASRTGTAVVVVRGGRDEPSAEPVVVGVDGSRASERAIGFAYDFASRHGGELVAVHAWSDLSLDPFFRVRSWEMP